MTGPDAVAAAITLPEPDHTNGLKLYQLLITENPARRRVETVRFQDSGRVRRSVSLDYLIPADLLIDTAEEGAPQTSFVAPIALMHKAQLTMLDVEDETGRSLPVLSTQENGALAYHALVAAATVASRPLGMGSAVGRMLVELYRIATEPTGVASGVLRSLLDSPDAEVRTVANDPVVRKLATDFAGNFVLMVEVERSPASRRLTKFSYTTRSSSDSRSEARRRGVRGAVARALVTPNIRTLEFACPSIGDAGSYHFQVEPPSGVIVTRCDLHLAPSRLPGGGRTEPDPVIGEVNGGVGHAHLTAPDPEARGSVIVEVSPSSHGLVASAGVAAGLIFAVALTLALLHSFALIDLAQAVDWGSILLAIPAIAAGFLVNQSESGLVSRLITPVRVTLVASGLVSFALAFVVGTMAAVPGLLVPSLWTATVVCGICFAWLAIWWRRCRSALRVAGVD